MLRCVAVSICLALLISCANVSSPGASNEPVKLDTEEQKTLYALGLLMGRNLQTFALTPEELAVVQAGVRDLVTGATPQVELETYGPKVNELAMSRQALGSADEKKKGQEFADTVAKEQDAVKLPSGIVVRTITAGTGASPAATDVVKVHYEGKLINGTIFDSSVERGEPVEFGLNQVVPCWGEALQTMKKGQKAQIVCPSDMAYGDNGAPPDIPPGATLSFEVELIDFKKP